MTIDELYDGVCIHKELNFHMSDTPGAVYIKHGPTHAFWEVFPADLRDEPWELMERIFCGRAPWVALRHVTRIVGYYSSLDNWNLSKLGELADRRKAVGHYGVPETS